MANLIPLKAGRNIWGHFLKPTSLAVRGGWKSPLYLAFCIYVVREILLLLGKKNPGILKSDVYGNHGVESSLLTSFLSVKLTVK